MLHYIYKHTSPEGKVYIGQTIQPKIRFKANGCKYKGMPIYEDIQKYGWNNFEHTIIQTTYSDSTANILEQMWISYYRKRCSCYNRCDGGAGTKGADRAGEKNPMYGKRGALSPSYGRKHTIEERKAISERIRGKNNPMYGKHISEDVKAKISAANKGKHRSEETRKKLSIACKGRILSEETKAKISAARKGKTAWNKGKTLQKRKNI